MAFLPEISTALGMQIFTVALILAGLFYFLEEKTEFQTPEYRGAKISYALAVIGATLFTFAWQGIQGIMGAMATAIFFSVITSILVQKLK